MNNIRRTITLAGLFLGLLMSTVLVIGASSTPAQSATVHRPGLPAWAKRPCASEDSVNCYWNARLQGNGHGHSYYVRLFPGSARMVCVMYVSARYARHNDYCEATR